MSKKRPTEGSIVELDYAGEIHIITLLHQNDEKYYGLDTINGSLKDIPKDKSTLVEVR